MKNVLYKIIFLRKKYHPTPKIIMKKKKIRILSSAQNSFQITFKAI
jgi:hypothetical protein